MYNKLHNLDSNLFQKFLISIDEQNLCRMIKQKKKKHKNKKDIDIQSTY